MNLVMPRLGLTMTEGALSEWLVAEGAVVAQGQILFLFESEKATMEFESPAAGVLSKRLVAAGVTVPCGTPVAVLETKSIDNVRSMVYEADVQQNDWGQTESIVHAVDDSLARQFVPATPAARRRARELGVDLAALIGRGPKGRIQLADVEQHPGLARERRDAPQAENASPLARKLAADLGLDLTGLSGGGPGGQITRADVIAEARRRLAGLGASTVPPSSEPSLLYASVTPLAGVRRVIAERMAASAFTAPHVTLLREVDATAFVETRSQLNAGQPGDGKISYNTLLVAVVARALRQHPGLNACLIDGEIRAYAGVNVALAVDTPRGLLAPVIRHADRLTLGDIQRLGDELIARALAGTSTPDDLAGGAFTITNLGSLGVDGFTPIINQPQAAILGVGRIVRKPAEHNGNLALREMLTLSLSFDHRIVDGAPAARFLQSVAEMIEQPLRLLLGS
jgi:pyruvate dehydrogenase E2 component (dihydrolipoamide acetyltransferase)